jgi:uncharacterized membrane protein
MSDERPPGSGKNSSQPSTPVIGRRDAEHANHHARPQSHGHGPRAGRESRSERRTRTASTRRAIQSLKARHAAERTLLEHFADRLTRWAGTATFFVVHVLWFAVWIPWNIGALRWTPFDPFPFGLLTMVVSLEAIFLTIFVLMTQNRESSIAELREELTLQVNLRMEEEVTKTLQLVAGLYARLNLELGDDDELTEMLKPLDPEEIENKLLEQINDTNTHVPTALAKLASQHAAQLRDK